MSIHESVAFFMGGLEYWFRMELVLNQKKFSVAEGITGGFKS
jgi:hypothetical protein